MAVDLKATRGLCQRHWDLGDKLGGGIHRGFLKVSDTVAVKIGATWDAEDPEIEYGWLKYLAPRVDSTKGYGAKASLPLGQHDKLTLLVIQYVPGPAIQQNLDDGHEFTNGDAMKVCEAYLTLRAIRPKGDELFPTGPWLLKGHIFQPDGEGGLKMKSRSDF